MTAQLEQAPNATRAVGAGLQTRWLAAFARGLAASDLTTGAAAVELREAAGHDAVRDLRAARDLVQECAARAIIDTALALTDGPPQPSETDVVDRLLANAELFDDPAAYTAGVRDAVAALRGHRL